MILKKLSYTLIIIGAILLCGTYYISYKEKENTKDLIASFKEIPSSSKTSGAKKSSTDYKIGDLIGILTIPAISLEIPILEGTEEEVLNKGAGHLTQSGALAKENENFIIAGHRSHIKGRFFNRLNDLEKGDVFYIQTSSEKLKYKIIKKRVILPTDFNALREIKGKALTTLVTCHPMYSSKKRLIIIAEQIAADS